MLGTKLMPLTWRSLVAREELYVEANGVGRRTAVVTDILSKGVDLSARDEKGATPLHYTVTGFQTAPQRHEAAVRLLSKDSPIHYLEALKRVKHHEKLVG